ncbi:MAG: ABC transporter substrate-binding protein, partial [Roseobacter sp.]|nr:ABC transporter substrate-binding protein [Roseobacter sp.]
MKLTKTLLATTALTVAAGFVSAQEMANEMTIVSWGGAYSNSQQQAYHNPYMEKTGVKIINDESSNEA